MTKLLYVVGSPRQTSYSSAIGEAFVSAYREAHPHDEIDTLDLWTETLPEFDGDRAAAKMSIIAGQTLQGREATAWDKVTAVIDRFSSADHYLFTVPMWNGSIPYRLKLLIDIVTQPGLLFGLDANGYSGLLHGKMATVIYTSGVYADGVPKAFGSDYQKSYFNWWLGMIGIEDIETLSFAANMMTSDPQTALENAKSTARSLAQKQVSRPTV
jgi:FMN-dependent NADH-azoreductase